MELDWTLSIICQRKTSVALKCPLENPVKKGNKKDAYKNFPNHVKQFQHLDSLPMIVKFGCETRSRGKRKRLNSDVCFFV